MSSSDRRSSSPNSRSNSPAASAKNAIPFRDAGDAGLVSKKFRDALVKGNEDENSNVGMGAAIVGLIISLAFIALQIYILYYTFKLERIGCECARDFRRTYAQAYIIASLAVYATLGVLEALTNAENLHAMAIAKAVLNGVMFLSGIVYVVFVWQYISRLRRIKCACSTSLARDVWEVVNYIQAAIIIITVIILVIAMAYSASIYQSLTSPIFPK